MPVRHGAFLSATISTASIIMLAVAAARDDSDQGQSAEDRRQARLAAKPWYASDTTLFGRTIPISPMSILISVLALWNLIRGFTKASTAEGSHILIQDHTDATKKLLEDMKRDIGDDPTKFAKCAREHSSCPSKNDGGNLGKWKQGTMAPPFDKAVFDPNNSINKTIGPVHTQFGWHLIYVRKRTIA